MKTTFLLSLVYFPVFSQCPCVKTAWIGTAAKGLVTYSNSVIAMETVEIKLGEGVLLYAQKHSGELSWYSKGERLIDLFVSPLETTTYTVKSSLKNCPDAYDMVTLPVSEWGAVPRISIFPNPVEQIATVESEGRFIKSIQVYNLVGRRIWNNTFSDNLRQHSIYLGNLRSGIYVVYVLLEDGNTIVEKIIKK